MESPGHKLQVQCCIVGGGPAGMVLGYLLARYGHKVAVLEKHGDFLRDFRGDTVHPSTLQVLDELGLLDKFLAMPHTELRSLSGQVGKDRVTIANFSGVRGRAKFIALMPQWDFLNFLAAEGANYSGFNLLMRTDAVDVIQEWGRVVGVRAQSPDGPVEIRADVVVAADGRHSKMRDALHVQPESFGAPMDVLWFRISRDSSEALVPLGYVGAGAIFVTIDRGDYWQCGYVIPKGSLEQLQAGGLDALRNRIATLAPFLAAKVGEIKSLDDVKLLEVRVDRLAQWYLPGILFIGDAAHAMSPVGGVGINLAIQDAVAAANVLAPALEKAAPVPDNVLAAVQERREWPTKMTQEVQLLVQKRIIASVLALKEPPREAPLLAKLISASPLLQRIPARIVGVGFRPEHASRRLLDRARA